MSNFSFTGLTRTLVSSSPHILVSNPFSLCSDPLSLPSPVTWAHDSMVGVNMAMDFLSKPSKTTSAELYPLPCVTPRGCWLLNQLLEVSSRPQSELFLFRTFSSIRAPWESVASVGLRMWKNLIAALFIWPHLHVHNITQPGRGFSLPGTDLSFQKGPSSIYEPGLLSDLLFTTCTTTDQKCVAGLACCCPNL